MHLWSILVINPIQNSVYILVEVSFYVSFSHLEMPYFLEIIDIVLTCDFKAI